MEFGTWVEIMKIRVFNKENIIALQQGFSTSSFLRALVSALPGLKRNQ